jgi:hypothetical protein
MAFIKGKQLASATVDSRELKDASVTNAKLAGSIPASKLDLTDDFDFSSGTLTVATPTQDGHAATKGYVDGQLQGLDIKDSVVAATTAIMATSASSSVTAQTIVLGDEDGGFDANANTYTVDDIALSQDDRVLIKDGININNTGADQTVNGIYTVGALDQATLTLTRADDSNTSAELSPGSFCFVEQGTTNGDSGFVASHDTNPTLGTSDITYTQFSGAGAVGAGDGLSKSGTTLSVNLDSNSGLAVSANGLKLDGTTLTDSSSVTVASDSLVAVVSNATEELSIATLVGGVKGTGLTATNGQLSVNISSTGGLQHTNDNLQVKLPDSSLESDATGLKVKLHTEASLAIKGSAGLVAPIILKNDLGNNPTSAVSSGTGSTGLGLTDTPASNSIVRVFVNGVSAQVGYGDKTLDCFFSGDSGTTARDVGSIVATDVLYWNADASYAISTDDLVDFVYATHDL